ncbi:hypothetical protein T484DRAFT_1839365 [Baffinella frigidus]|jgi:hypothetical protein|nr:hypothetical protein T484DRAFT_1839365 [Cryptophyta sp. CCMP2293]
MATPPSVLALLALMCMTLLVIPSSAFVPTFPATSHALRLRSSHCPMVVREDNHGAARIIIQMSGRKDEQDYFNEKEGLNPKLSGGRNDTDLKKTIFSETSHENPDNSECEATSYAGNRATHTYSTCSQEDDYRDERSYDDDNL